jgi:hypothetical protein
MSILSRPLPAMAALVAVLSLPGTALASVGCDLPRPQASPGTSLLVPVAEELAAPNAQLGAGVGFARLMSDDVSVDRVIARMRQAQCLASAPPPPSAVQPGAAYQPKDGGTAWRFDMTQNGKRMTADEFDAWMKARGVRVVPARGAAATPAPAAPAPAPAPAEPPKKKKGR